MPAWAKAKAKAWAKAKAEAEAEAADEAEAVEPRPRPIWRRGWRPSVRPTVGTFAEHLLLDITEDVKVCHWLDESSIGLLAAA